MDPVTHLLSRGVDTVYPNREAFERVLRSGKKLRVFQGFDPTGTALHIGHAVALRKLRQFQDLGHHVIFLIGDGTGQAGDPSGKMKARGRFMSRDELRENARDYVKQAGKIIRFSGENPVEILYNGDWLTNLKLEDILDIAQHFSVQQLIERDMFQERMKRNESINLREFLYPLLQGYDSVAMDIDVEIGGSDQSFNMLCGRQLVSSIQKREKYIMTVPLLTDAKGVKIGKSEGNVIALTDAPDDFYGKIMALGDDAIIPCFTLLTDTSETDIRTMKEDMASGDNPVTFKKRLAYELTRQFNSESEAGKAQENFEQTFSKKNITDNMYIPVTLSSGATIYDALGQAPLSLSKSEAKRQITAGSVTVNAVPVTLESAKTPLNPGDRIQKGSHTFLRVETHT